jgi:hypothetical protein
VTIEKFPQPPRVTPYKGDVLDAEEGVKLTLSPVLSMGPAMFNENLPNTFTIATSGHIIMCAFSVGGETEEESLDLTGMGAWFDELLAPHADEPVTTVILCVPMEDMVLIHAWDASGHTAYTLLEPGPYPGVVAISNLHCHLPPRAPDPNEGNLIDEIIAASGKHLWGAHWALLPGMEDGC